MVHIIGLYTPFSKLKLGLFDYRILVTETFGDNLPSDLTDRMIAVTNNTPQFKSHQHGVTNIS